MIKPPGKPGPSIFLPKQPKRTPMDSVQPTKLICLDHLLLVPPVWYSFAKHAPSGTGARAGVAATAGRNVQTATTVGAQERQVLNKKGQ